MSLSASASFLRSLSRLVSRPSSVPLLCSLILQSGSRAVCLRPGEGIEQRFAQYCPPPPHFITPPCGNFSPLRDQTLLVQAPGALRGQTGVSPLWLPISPWWFFEIGPPLLSSPGKFDHWGPHWASFPGRRFFHGVPDPLPAGFPCPKPGLINPAPSEVLVLDFGVSRHNLFNPRAIHTFPIRKRPRSQSLSFVCSSRIFGPTFLRLF